MTPNWVDTKTTREIKRAAASETNASLGAKTKAAPHIGIAIKFSTIPRTRFRLARGISNGPAEFSDGGKPEEDGLLESASGFNSTDELGDCFGLLTSWRSRKVQRTRPYWFDRGAQPSRIRQKKKFSLAVLEKPFWRRTPYIRPTQRCNQPIFEEQAEPTPLSLRATKR
jgi:hypothetical protein